MLKNDHLLFGILIGLILPVMIFGMIYLVNYFLVNSGVTSYFINRKALVLIGIAGNVIPIRYYFVNARLDKTARGILLVTFVMIILFFALDEKIV
ncbi:MAG: hypothetical protein FJY07_03845 [Bacteroidetes bacterium]|nr:hypothetical protein [Bacteroidota bacterium]